MTDRKQRIHTQLAESRAYLVSVAQQIGPEQTLASTENLAWNVHDLLAHLAGAERGLQATVQRFLAGVVLPEDFSLDTWNQRQVEKQKERSAADLLAGLAVSRVETLALLDSLSDEQLAVRGMHPAGFETSVGGIFRVMAMHELDHGQEIALALGLPVEQRVEWNVRNAD
ncbi:MAG TPA: maleylpyruvate isomerase family mycothiol-dependent enzyme [Anaerolineae bacterium]|nr:maleylpyruvate isomerase family mycothiol-dependent enzyme [Anaerolineae bacterium]